MLQDFIHNFTHNLFKPLLLFFYAGFLIPLLHIKFEFPKALYQSITIYLLLAIGWHGGEELATLSPAVLGQALGFMLVGFLTNLLIGYLAYFVLRRSTRLRQIDAATVAGYYGSDSAGTFVTCLGVLTAAGIAYAPYMPVMLAIMEIPGCLVALLLVAGLRRRGMDAAGYMPGEAGYQRLRPQPVSRNRNAYEHDEDELEEYVAAEQLHVAAQGGTATLTRVSRSAVRTLESCGTDGHGGHSPHEEAEAFEDEISLRDDHDDHPLTQKESKGFLSPALLHEVFLNPGIYLLFAGIAIGFISRLQGEKVTAADDSLFVTLFQGILCLFLLEMGMTASKKLKDLRTAGWQFVAFALIAPNVFATLGICVAHGYSLWLGQPFAIGTYALFAVLCGAASYIALPAVQRMALPEASPTLPLAASLGVTFSYNVTIGIPVYLLIATVVTKTMPVYPG